MQQERYGHSTLCINGVVHVFGGYECTNSTEPESLYTAEKYKDRKWVDIAEMPIPTAFAGVCLLEDSMVYLFGGISSFEVLNTVQQWNAKTGDWKILKWHMPLKMAKFGVAVDHQQTIFVMGGVTEGETDDSQAMLGTAYRLKKGDTHWTKIANMKSKKTVYEAVPSQEGTFIVLPNGGSTGGECESLMANHVRGR